MFFSVDIKVNPRRASRKAQSLKWIQARTKNQGLLYWRVLADLRMLVVACNDRLMWQQMSVTEIFGAPDIFIQKECTELGSRSQKGSL